MVILQFAAVDCPNKQFVTLTQLKYSEPGSRICLDSFAAYTFTHVCLGVAPTNWWLNFNFAPHPRHADIHTSELEAVIKGRAWPCRINFSRSPCSDIQYFLELGLFSEINYFISIYVYIFFTRIAKYQVTTTMRVSFQASQLRNINNK